LAWRGISSFPLTEYDKIVHTNGVVDS